MKEGSRKLRVGAADLEAGGRSHGPRDAGGLDNLEEEGILPCSL